MPPPPLSPAPVRPERLPPTGQEPGPEPRPETRPATRPAAPARGTAGRAADAAEAPAGWVPAVSPPAPAPLAPGLPASTLRAALLARLPPALRGARIALGRRAVTGLALVALAGAAVAVALLVQGRPHPVAVDGGPEVSGPVVLATAPADRGTPHGPAGAGPHPVSSGVAPTVGGPSPSSPPSVVVDVAGRVRHPGVLRLRSGSRVVDALAAAGGTLPGVVPSDLDQARPLVDGEQLRVGLGPAPASAVGPLLGPSAGAGAGAGGSAAVPSVPLDLNTATVEQLDTLPGVGPVLAQRILDWRTAHGGFHRVEDLKGVSGLGGRKYDVLAPRLRV